MGQHLVQLLPSGQQPIPVCAVNHKDDELASRGEPRVVSILFAESASCPAVLPTGFLLPRPKSHRRHTVQAPDLTALVPLFVVCLFVCLCPSPILIPLPNQTQGAHSTTSGFMPEATLSPGHSFMTPVSPLELKLQLTLGQQGDWGRHLPRSWKSMYNLGLPQNFSPPGYPQVAGSRAPMDTKIRGCPSPLYKMTQNNAHSWPSTFADYKPQIEKTTFDPWLAESAGTNPRNPEG